MTLPRPIMISLRELCLWNVKMGVPQTKTFLNIAFTSKHSWNTGLMFVSFSWAGASLLSLVLESPRDGVLIKILIPITMLCYPIDLMKYQFDSWWSLVLTSWSIELLFSLGWESPGDGVSIKIMVPMTMLDYLRLAEILLWFLGEYSLHLMGRWITL